MNNQKRNKLDIAYQSFMDLMLKNFPLDRLSEFVNDDIMGYGTTIEEKLFGPEAVRDLIITQRKQREAIQFSFKIFPVYRKIASDENMAIYVDEVYIHLKQGDHDNEINLRLSLIFDYTKEGWKLIHWHGSKPEYDSGGTDTWHVGEWEKRNEELEKLVLEKTADLEVKNKELIIEAALERIRSKAQGMQKSSEVGDVNDVLFEEFTKMGIEMIGCGISVINEETDHCEQWRARQVAVVKSFEPYSYNKSMEILHRNLPDWTPEFIAAWKRGDSFITKHLEEKERDAYLTSVASIFNYSNSQRKEILTSYPNSFVANFIFYKRGWLSLSTINHLTDDEINFSRRFVEAFDFAHTRFADLKRAEEQAREANIEAALERIRSKALGMQHSDDLSIAVAKVFEEIENLGLSATRCGIGIIDKKTRKVDLWTTTQTANGNTAQVTGNEPLQGHPLLETIFKHWTQQKALNYILEGNDLVNFYEVVGMTDFQLPDETVKSAISITSKQYYHCSFFPAGGLYVFGDTPFSDDDIQILQRFADVFHMAFTRYIDLKNAETRALDAIKQASLDKVRAEIASMRSTKDLDMIIPIIWQELVTLNVPFNRCGIFIIDDDESKVHAYLSTPEGKSLGILNLPFDINDLTLESVEYWRRQEVYTAHWNKEEFVNWMKSLLDQGLIQNQKSYQGTSKPPESLNLHFIPFAQGMLYVGNSDPLSSEKITLVKALAQAFSIAYSRYEDFVILEEAKNKVELTLSELKSTQAQLIHSEKMASLGELTAGIAHEIQNPLNFVNNFSEVSVDLIDEMNEEMELGNKEDVITITQDLKENLEKITHHGQRASSIVKGMLEHSRAGDGHKELTDINALADEYLRLSYHGLRAKDKSFNADFKVDLDENLPKIKVVPQDIGRVLLNLINNAFYAVNEKAKKGIKGYSPLVTLVSRKKDSGVELKLTDNGGGIPYHILDKIFQPFFTTKPTGEGTGLGLSLSYDIITKGHDGELEVNTKEGEGTEFIIVLPAK